MIEMRWRYVWRTTHVRDPLDSLYRGFASGSNLIMETDERVHEHASAIGQQANPYARIQESNTFQN